MPDITLDPNSFLPGRIARTNNETFNRRFDELCTKHPIARLHREAFGILGGDFVDVHRWDAPGDRNAWTALVRFGRTVERALSLTREVMVFYSAEQEFQRRDYTRLVHFLKKQPRSPDENICFIHINDPMLQKKLVDWATQEPLGVVRLPTRGDGPEVAAQILGDLTSKIASQNLYDERLPVTGHDFFGRRALLLDLVEQLRRGKVCGIFGLRKTGKTSLVKELGQRFVAFAPGRRIFVLRDLEDLPTDPKDHAQALHMDITSSLLPKLRELELRTHELAQLTSDSPIGDFRRAMQATLGHERSRDIQMVIALDEIESLVGRDPQRSMDRPDVPEFLGVLRSLVQENSNFNVVISGLTSSVLESGVLYGRENPLFAWAKPYYMPPLERSEADDLVQTIGSRMALRWAPDALEFVFSLTEGHVFLHRTLCARIADGLSLDLSEREITVERARSAQRAWRRGISEQVQEMLASLERFYPDSAEVLRMLAVGSLTADEADLEFAPQAEQLIRLGLLRESESDYELTAFSRMALRRPVQ